jgi:prevent-host-death family protein
MWCYLVVVTTRIGVRELRQNASRYLTRVKAGETIEVTERGVLVAVLAPPSPPATARDRLVAAGRLIPASKPWRPPRPLAVDGPSNADVLAELREERL